ncbi:MAG: GNAT family N-acetyltransferase, partial [Pseudomonadota bacterium]
FTELGLSTLVSYIDPENARSIALAERLGAVRDDEAEKPEDNPLVYRHPTPEASA